ncbi:RAB6IP1-like protein [Operophtera brumata]|uniref:RAB6IP1-like protein n=1 Tax=Operophtera brumata TaxID=104452 RepID=A0A0L7LQT8_OPEBR|nr:RAB6IP1-like protein [Operophtera brumata]
MYTRAGVNIDDVDADTVMPTTKKKILNDEEQYNEDIRFNYSIRETFLNRFVHIFLMYENFASFLSDQPQRHRPFLSRFLETQMFATLIDNKIMANWGDYDANLQVFEHRIKSVRTNSLKRIKNAKWQVKDCPPELLLGDISRRLSTEVTPAAIAQNNRTFVEKLLKECKSKTKRMLVEKMGTEEPDLGLGCEVSITGVEETTMIASLCDLLERLWSHGLQHKMGKSALWMHLINYQELEQCSNSTKPIDPNYLTPDLSSVGAEVEAQQSSGSSTRSRDSSRAGSRDSSRDRLSNSGTLERKPPNPLRPLPESLTFDMRSQYKRTAFLRCEEEREQFLYHLLTLNAVDYKCFTNTYPTTKRLLVAARMRNNEATPRTPAPLAPPMTPTTTHLSTSTIQHMIVKWHYQSKREKDANSLSVLLCGENGLVKCLEQAFLCGFKQDQEHRAIWRCYCHLMDEINSVGRTLGKDGKFQLFICLSLRAFEDLNIFCAMYLVKIILHY